MAKRRKSVAAQVAKILDDSLEAVKENSDSIFENAAEASVDILHQVSPKDSGQYARCWTYKRYTNGKLVGYVVYNATDYQLTHLLEYGHALWNGRKRVRPQRHIKPVETAMMEKVQAEMQHVADEK